MNTSRVAPHEMSVFGQKQTLITGAPAHALAARAG